MHGCFFTEAGETWEVQMQTESYEREKKPNHKFFYCSTLCEIPAAYLFAHNTNTSLEPVLVSSKYTN